MGFKIISLFGLISVGFYFLHIVFGNIFYEGYNPLAQAISDLTADSSPSKNIARIFSMFYGVFSVIFSIGFFAYLKGKINKIITIASFTFFSMNIISFFGYTFFPLSESGYAGTFQDIMHMIVTILVVIFTIISLVLFCIGFLKTKEYKCIGVISIFTLFLLVLGVILINILPSEYFGIAQRVNVYSIIIYTGILSLWIYKNNGNIGIRKKICK